ncbi:MAG: transglycosylase domain-containing protein, partial [Actinobacteria bacterium]|nr:transglycosylase domain-containing protein [Actinomycetota bacterium]
LAILVGLIVNYWAKAVATTAERTGARIPGRRRKRPLLLPKMTVRPAFMLAAAAASGLGAVLFVNHFMRPDLPPTPPYTQTSMIFDASGEMVATLHGEENRVVVPLEDISPHLQNGIIAAEDREFYEHNGVSWRGIIRAARANLEEGETLQGGSTITQQYVRNAFPQVGKERTIERKAKEALWAMEVEKKFGKAEILQAYLNTVYFGQGAYGAEAAAKTYFGVSAADLTPGQAAYMSVILRSPGQYQIDKDPESAILARNDVIDDMASLEALSPEEARLAKQEDLAAQYQPALAGAQEGSARAGYFVEYVRRTMKSKFQFTDEEILGGGLRIHTTLDLNTQKAAEEAVSSTLDRPDDPEGALIAMDPQGRVRAMVGGKDIHNPERARGHNFAADVQNGGGGRPAGSAFKPIALASFLEEGNSVYSTFMGHRTMEITSERCKNEDGSPWEVSNYAHSEFGALNLISATTNSVNTIYAQLMDSEVTPEDFIETASDLGIEIPQFDRGCALTLGTTDVTPLEMAQAYTAFAQRGTRPDPMVITKVTGPDGEVIVDLSPSTQQVLDSNTADTINYVLQRNIRAGTGTRAQIGRPAAGKTGTTQDFSNAWFAGYTPDLTAVVWMGYAPVEDGTIPLMKNVRGRPVTGGSFPAEIWGKFMSAALEGTEESYFTDPRLGGRTVRYQIPEDALQIAEADDGGSSSSGNSSSGDSSSGDDSDEQEASPPAPPPAPAPGGDSDKPSAPSNKPQPSDPSAGLGSDCFPFCGVDR